MRTRLGITFVIALTLPLLAACSAPAPAPTPTAEPAPASIEGSWDGTRTLTDSSVSNEGIEIGDTDSRYFVFSDITCDDDGTCVGVFNSAASDSEEDQAAGGSGDLTWDGDALTLSISSLTDCTFTDGTVAFAEAYVVDTVYDLNVADGDDESVSAFSGTMHSVVTTTEDAIASGCPDSNGERTFDVEVVPAA